MRLRWQHGLVGACALAVTLAACNAERTVGPEEVAGGSSTETSNRLAARFVDGTGHDAAGAVVRIRPLNWGEEGDPDTLVGLLRTSLDTILDSTGSLVADSFRTGTYTLEVELDDEALRLDLASNGKARPVDTLLERGGLGGLFVPAWKGTIRILGTDLVVTTDSLGNFRQADLAAGPVTMDFRADSAGITRRLRLRTFIPPRATADLGGVSLLTRDEEQALFWPRRAKWVIDNTTTGLTRDVADYPLWIPLPDSIVRGLQPEATDLRVLDEDGLFRPLDYTPGSTNGIWARMSKIDGSSNEHHVDVLWGRSDVPSWSDPTSAFDSAAGWRAVWHLDKSLACATRGCSNLAGTPVYDSGIVREGARFDGSRMLTAIDSGTLEPADLTVSMWVHIESIAGTESKLVWKDSNGAGAMPSWAFLLRKVNDTMTVGFRTRGGPSDSGIFMKVPTGQWVQLGATVDRARAKAEIFVDGVSGGTYPIDSIAPASRNGSLRVGQGFVGRIDELRVARIARPVAWFTLERINFLTPGMLLHP